MCTDLNHRNLIDHACPHPPSLDVARFCFEGEKVYYRERQVVNQSLSLYPKRVFYWREFWFYETVKLRVKFLPEVQSPHAKSPADKVGCTN